MGRAMGCSPRAKPSTRLLEGVKGAMGYSPSMAERGVLFQSPQALRFAERNHRANGGAFAGRRIKAVLTADHLHAFPHAEHPQSISLVASQHPFHIKAFAIVGDFHLN